jgi:5'-AMP-activated protein kinase regulatory beta subunit
MKKVQSKQKTNRKKITFSIEADVAKEVILMGDFNHWKPNKHKMKKDKHGSWIKTLILSPGKYEYKFLIDGEWKEDPQNPQVCSNCFGTVNSVVNLSA